MKIFVSLIISLTLCTSLYGQELYDLEVGKTWKYAVSGKEPYEVVNHISRSKIIDGKRWFQLIEYGEKFWVINSSQGQMEAVNLNETDAEKTDNLGVELIFKFPAHAGETWVSAGTPTKYIGIKEISVPAGKFRCHMYHMDLGGKDYSDTCIAKGVGVIYNEAILDGGEKEISRLLSYGKKSSKPSRSAR